MKQQASPAQQRFQFDEKDDHLPPPHKKASESEVQTYAERRFHGNRKKAARFVAGWFMVNERFSR